MTNFGCDVDSETRTRERQRLMMDMLERKIRLRARQLYHQRGQEEGKALEDWIQAETEILKSSILAPLWSKGRQRSAEGAPQVLKSESGHRAFCD